MEIRGHPRLLRIEAVLNVERDTQKKILIGHKGAMAKEIGTESAQGAGRSAGQEGCFSAYRQSGAGLARKSAACSRIGLAFSA